MKRKKSVLEKLVEQCEKSFLGSRPCIAIDTYEIEVVEALIRKFRLVDLKMREESAFEKLRINKYVLANTDSKPVNLLRDSTELLNYISASGRDKLPFIATIQIGADSKGNIEADIVNELRMFVNEYATTTNPSSYIRNSVVFLYGDVILLPDDIRKSYMTVLDVDLPEMWERCEIVKNRFEENKIFEKIKAEDSGFVYNDKSVEKLVKMMAGELAGFSFIECGKIVDWLINLNKNEDGEYYIFSAEEREKLIFERKEQVLKSLGDMMTLYKPKAKNNKNDKSEDTFAANVQGFDNYYKWIEKNEKQIIQAEDFALTRGLGALKGVLITGIPGCGKSEAVSILRERWRLNTLRLDIGSLMGGLVGASEANLRKALKTAESMAPVILYIDEIEKGFSGANSNRDDGSGSVFKRMFAYLLTWMQEKENKEVFIFATANNIGNLPPEFLRSERFDALFCVCLPNESECIEIFREHMKRVEKVKSDRLDEYGVVGKRIFNFTVDAPKSTNEKDYLRENLEEVVEFAGAKGKFLTGADIKKIIKETLRGAEREIFENGFGPDEWKEALKETIGSGMLMTQGSSSANLDEIAASYIRLMRKDLIPVSKNILFSSEHYKVKSEKQEIEAEYNGEIELNSASGYDNALYKELRKRVNALASEIEQNERKKITS